MTRFLKTVTRVAAAAPADTCSALLLPYLQNNFLLFTLILNYYFEYSIGILRVKPSIKDIRHFYVPKKSFAAAEASDRKISNIS